MKIVSLFVALAVILLAVPTAQVQADACRVPSHHQHVAVVQQVAHAAQFLPLYGVGYAAGGYSAAGDGETNRLLLELIAEMRAMNARLDVLAGGGAAAGANADTLASANVQKALAVSCAQCHTGEKAKAGFMLFTDKGEPVRLSGPDRKAMAKAVSGGSMPPADKVKMAATDRELILKAVAK